MNSAGSIGKQGKALAPIRGSQPGCADPIGHADMLIAQLGESTSMQLVKLYASNWPGDTYWPRVLARLQEQRLKTTQMLAGEPRAPRRAPLRKPGAAPTPPTRRRGAAPISEAATSSRRDRR